MALDATVPDTNAQFHLDCTSLQVRAAAVKAAIAKKTKYTGITNTHVFISVAIQTGGSFNAEATKLIQDMGKESQASMEKLEERLIIATHLYRYPERKCVGLPDHIPNYRI